MLSEYSSYSDLVNTKNHHLGIGRGKIVDCEGSLGVGLVGNVEYTLMLHTNAEEKRVRVPQMWARAGWDRMNST